MEFGKVYHTLRFLSSIWLHLVKIFQNFVKKEKTGLAKQKKLEYNLVRRWANVPGFTSRRVCPKMN